MQCQMEVDQMMESKTGHRISYRCYGTQRESLSFTSMVGLVPVMKDNCSPIWQKRTIACSWLLSVRGMASPQP